MKKLLSIFCCIIFFNSNSFSQDQYLIDSLQTRLKQLEAERMELRKGATGIRDSSIAKILFKISLAYQDNNPDKAMDYSKQALALCEQIGWKKGVAISCFRIGIVYANQNNYPEALKNYLAALKIFGETGNKKRAADVNNSIGTIYMSQGNYPEALKNHFASLKIFEEFRDKQGIAYAYTNIAGVYWYQGNYSEALKNSFTSLKIFEEIGDKVRIGHMYSNIGGIYQKQGNYVEALKTLFSALKILEELGNKEGMAAVYNNLGTVYYMQNNYPEALKNYFAALKLYKAKYNIANSYNDIGQVYIKLKRAKEGKTWLQKGLDLSKEIGAKEHTRQSYESLAEADSALGNYKGAYENHKLYLLYKDSLFNEENTKKTTQQQMQMDFDKKQIADSIKVAEERKVNEVRFKQEKQQRQFLYGGLVLVLLFAGFMFNRFQISQKQKNIIASQKHLVEEKQKEILDSINYAERIQRSLLASKDLLNQNFGSEDNYFVLFKPKDIVSGDFYWASLLQNNHFALITADSTGHGVPGAIMSILNIACLNEAVKEGYISPSDILNRTRKEIISVLKRDGSTEGGKDGMDCSLCIYDFSNMKLYTAAANNPIWIMRNSNVIEMKPDKMPVGKHDKQGIPFTQHKFDLQKGDVVYTLTDGMPDQFGGEKGKKFMIKKLRELLVANSHLPMQEQKQILENILADWIGTLEQVDDITVIGVRV